LVISELKDRKMPKFSIYQAEVGEDLGTYEASTEALALDAMAQSFGFKDYADCVAEYGVDLETARAELRITVVPPVPPASVLTEILS
jgi:hypothetical protein